MKGAFYFIGSFLRWLVQKPSQSSVLAIYLIIFHISIGVAKSYFSESLALVVLIGVLAPFMYAIAKGLPLDCLNYEAAINKEFSVDSKSKA